MKFHYDKVLQERFSLTDEESSIIETPIFQRLKKIKQNGFSYFVYSDAVGTRYDHSIGSVYWVLKLYHSIFPNESTIVKNNPNLRALRLAALTHDIGHGPFSHALEELLYRNEKWMFAEPWINLTEKFGKHPPHELISLEFISSSSFHKIVDDDKIESLTFNILNKKNELSLLISGDLDADRLDYLTRDSHYSGLPFGFNIKVIFNELLENNLRIEKINGNSFLTIDTEGLPAMEQFLGARYAHYKYLVYEPRVLLANLVFITSLEESLEKNIDDDEDISNIIYHVFKNMSDDELINLNFIQITNKKIREKVQHLNEDVELNKIYNNFESYCNGLYKNYIKLVNITKISAYNFLKEGRQIDVRNLEKIFFKKFGNKINFSLCLPSALTMNSCIYDPSVDPQYSPSFIYDYSPIVRGLEQKMYLDCGILISSNMTLDSEEILSLLETLPTSQADLDVYTYSLCNYISKIFSSFSKEQAKWELRRTRLFEFLNYLNEVLSSNGIMKKRKLSDTPWYSIEMYEIFQKLEFLDVINEDFNVRHGSGYIPFFVYSLGEFSDEILRDVQLSDEIREQILSIIGDYILIRKRRR